MEHDEPSFTDPAGEMHAEIIRRRAAEHRMSQRAFAHILDQRGWPHARIAELLEIEPATLTRLLAIDSKDICTECVYGFHSRCIGKILTGDGRLTSCECPACRI